MPKILFVSNTANFSKFNRPFMQYFRSIGWTVDYASAGEETVMDCDHQFHFPLARSPFDLKNIEAIREMKEFLDANQYDIIHCHTPMGGVMARLASKKLRSMGRTKIIYTAHGFHFYKGAPLLNWLLYYPVEKLLAKFTDVLITINQEDYDRAQKRFKDACENQHLVNGVGVDLSKFVPLSQEDRLEYRQQNGYSENDFIITIVAETNVNKNQIMLLKQLKKLAQIIPNIKVLLIGKETLPIARNFVEKHHLEDMVHFLGYRNDIPHLTGMSDVAFSASIREGLPVNIIEAMACEVPVVASINRGHTSLIKSGENGILFDLDKPEEMTNAILFVHEKREEALKLSKQARIDAQKFELSAVMNSMKGIYEQVTQGLLTVTKPKVSVIMSCYNCQRYIGLAIDSVLSQTYQNWELWICDDYSSDDTAKIAKSYVEKDSRIHYLCTPQNTGSPALPRNMGIEHATGRFIAILDCDDEWLPQKLEKQIPLFSFPNVGVVYADYEKIDGEEKPMNRTIRAPLSVNYHKLLYGNVIGNLTGVYDVQKIGKIYQQKIGAEDYLFWLEILKTGYTGRNAGEVLCRYREVASSLSGNKIRSSKWTWNIYRNVLKIPLPKCLVYFSSYAYKALIKHL